MQSNPSRPLSPHLGIYKWGPHMLVSILHRMTGAGLSIFGAAILVWWLVAAANGAESYDHFVSWAAWRWALIFWIPLSWGLFQHALSGLRHLVMDTGAGFELGANKFWAVMTLIGSTALTGLLWTYILGVR